VLSPRTYNEPTGLCIVCPITSHIKHYPFEVELPEDLPVQGVVLADHVKSADWRQRDAAPIAVAPAEVIDQVRAKLRPLLGI
jgi:mRNA interferase MazF